MSGEKGPSLDAVRDWILNEGRLIPGTAEFLEELGRALIAAGVPLLRATLHTRTLHPQVLATMPNNSATATAPAAPKASLCRRTIF